MTAFPFTNPFIDNSNKKYDDNRVMNWDNCSEKLMIENILNSDDFHNDLKLNFKNKIN